MKVFASKSLFEHGAHCEGKSQFLLSLKFPLRPINHLFMTTFKRHVIVEREFGFEPYVCDNITGGGHNVALAPLDKK